MHPFNSLLVSKLSFKMSTQRSASISGEGQGADRSLHPEHSLARHMPYHSRSNSLASPKASAGKCSRVGSISSIPSSTRAIASTGFALESTVDLLDAFDDFIDPDILKANENLFDAFFDSNTCEMARTDTTDIAKANQDANRSQKTILPLQHFSQDSQNCLGIMIPSAKDEQQSQLNPTTVLSNHQTETDLNLLDLVPVNHTENSAFEIFNEYSTFGHSDIDYAALMQSLETTPGLSAVPGDDSFSPELPLKTPQYPDPYYPTYVSEPYFVPSIRHSDGYIPIDPRLQPSPANVLHAPGYTGLTKPHQPKYEKGYSTSEASMKRKDTEPDSDSDEDMIPPKRRKVKGIKRKSRPQSDISRRNSSTSAESSLSKPMKLTKIRSGEKPRRCEEKSWVRINNTTKGETTRTARINRFAEEASRYKVKPLPVGNWSAENFKFEYNHHNGMDEFKKCPMSAEQIHEYITQYPGEHLRIWIQVTPGDSARRYASKPHSECLFERCPNRVWGHKGTIEVGNYRIAFDEKHKVYGKGVVDPFDCVGYAHLYCMERFLDFADVCKNADVKVDTRGDMEKEPKGEGGFTFSKKHVPERLLAEKFIKAARVGRLARTPEFSNYPIHAQYEGGQPKPHELTLTSAMFKVSWEHRARSQLKQFVSRDMKPTGLRHSPRGPRDNGS